ncbi:MAG: FG-GAP-like repeat-containing protein [Saprospiraceae bacterium]|nr:FG-GAP-like repeat-containing protein [Saprospiraceae bacterium]
MPKVFYLLFIIILFSSGLQAQMQRALVQEDFTIKIEQTTIPDFIISRENIFSQLPGFPKVTTAHSAFKNFRNATLADLTGDGTEEILLATNRTLFAYKNDTLLWSKPLTGAATYPPSVADMNNDGLPEIVQLTGGTNESGRLYVFDKTGQDLPNFPLNFNNNWMLLAPALADVNNDGAWEIIACERVAPAGRIHIIKLNGQSYNQFFPYTLDRTPAVTPSVGDLDGDGEMEIIVASTESLYILNLNGQIKKQITNPNGQRYSYQSPIIIDLDQDGKKEIVGATHGNMPQFFVLQHDGSFRNGWPIPVPNGNWTFSTPSVVKFGEYDAIMMSRPIGLNAGDVIFGWDKDANSLEGFPIMESGGQEGIISVADVDDDGKMELIFGSNLLGSDGYGFIHAYNLDETGQVEGFPLRPRGWTLMNGANVGDINGDGMMDLVVISYTQGTSDTDSTYLNVYNLNVPYSPDRVLWNTYKGNNTRNGLIQTEQTTAVKRPDLLTLQIALQQNPVQDNALINLRLLQNENIRIILYNNAGKLVKSIFTGNLSTGKHDISFTVADLPKGIYWLKASTDIHIKSVPFVKM